jgi:hypothetical protein
MDRIAHLAAGLILSSPAVAQTVRAPAQLYTGGDKHFEPNEPAKNIADIKVVTISPAR